ncbi:T-box transcription factor TBX6-like [Anopheles aquasalis]|uniref:T-box transcription factor TBX6-like n=1 Tax=Anopheles aquasalis TaxID=42839 RepID=UPI00215A4E0D|nr:T-box transcription factor TBX6-like [Anopheles aquasalis]
MTADLMDLRMHHHLALQTEFYRHQMHQMQRLPDPYPAMLPVPAPPARSLMMPPRYNTLPEVDVKLQNRDLWSQFAKIGTEMIITKSGRRMFPSMRLSVNGLEAEENYFILLEMVPISDCRFKFSGSQWVPAGGAEPQSPQRIYFHPDGPALGTHWTSQPIVFNKVKLTNNTLDSNGHIVLTSMHKYQPRIHVIKASDAAQIPWAPQQAFTFPETEFVAVTAYQNDRITKLKIDNNPFAKGFRETGQSRCKRKAGLLSSPDSGHGSGRSSEEDDESDGHDGSTDSPDAKRARTSSLAGSLSSLDDSELSVSDGASSGTSSPVVVDDFGASPIPRHGPIPRAFYPTTGLSLFAPHPHHVTHPHPALLAGGSGAPSTWMELMFPFAARPTPALPNGPALEQNALVQAAHQLQQFARREFLPTLATGEPLRDQRVGSAASPPHNHNDSLGGSISPIAKKHQQQPATHQQHQQLPFSISAILGHSG